MSWGGYLTIIWAFLFSALVLWDDTAAVAIGQRWPVMAPASIELLDANPADGAGSRWQIESVKLRDECGWLETTVWLSPRQRFPTDRVYARHLDPAEKRAAGVHVWQDFRIQVLPKTAREFVEENTYWNVKHKCRVFGPIWVNVVTPFYTPGGAT